MSLIWYCGSLFLTTRVILSLAMCKVFLRRGEFPNHLGTNLLLLFGLGFQLFRLVVFRFNSSVVALLLVFFFFSQSSLSLLQIQGVRGRAVVQSGVLNLDEQRLELQLSLRR